MCHFSMFVLFGTDVILIFLSMVRAWAGAGTCILVVMTCVVSVVVSQSVGNQVFPAFSIHRGK